MTDVLELELTKAALNSLSPSMPYALGQYLTVSGVNLPDTYIVYLLVSSVSHQHADNIETHRYCRVQISIYARGGLASLPDVDTAMSAQGFIDGPERQLPYDPETKHFGMAKDYFYLKEEA